MPASLGTSDSDRNARRLTAVCCSLAAVGGALIAATLLVSLLQGKSAPATYAVASAVATAVVLPPETVAMTLVRRTDPLFEPAAAIEEVPAAPTTVIAADPPAAAAAVPLPRPRPDRITRAAPGRSASQEIGLGSYYQPDTLACGGPVNAQALTAAHKSLPCGTLVKVTNTKNGRYAMVQINDRGPFIQGRVIDVNRAAARDLDMIGPGVVPVRVEVVR
jgi:rare lipoprotein A (peptidoglycan hydrolase)